MASKAKDQAKKAPKKKNGYQMPKPLKPGDILNDNQKKQWKIGVSIGVGGFGEIYSACQVGSSIKKVEDYPFVVKIEPKENGPLFVEMHFYMRNAKQEDIEKFKKDHKLKALGMPSYVAQGSHEIQQMKHRFIVLPRFGRDISKILEEQHHKIPLHTVYRLGWQILYALQYIHSRTYVHCDIKASNIMLSFGKGGEEQVYLLDFGLACHYSTKDFKPDPKKMHNGTIEYTSRDAHQGVPTMRGDIEVLAYNLIEWAGGKLPWVTNKLLANSVSVQKAKEEFMKTPEKSVRSCFETAPVQIIDVFKYLGSMKHDSVPDYPKLRGIFEAGVKEQGQKNAGALEFHAGKKAAPAKAARKSQLDDDQPGPSKKVAASKRARESKRVVEEASDSDEEVAPPRKVAASPKKSSKTATSISLPETPEANIPEKTRAQRNKETKRYVYSDEEEDDDVRVRSPKKQQRAAKSPSSRESPPLKKTKSNDKPPTPTEVSSEAITIKSKGKSSKGKKVIHLNFNLDVSLNSDVVVVVNRKDKKKKEDKAPKPDENDPTNRAGVYKGKFAKTQ